MPEKLIRKSKPGLLPASPIVSVIIPTKDREEDLELTVGTILRQSVLPSELIIVDQSKGKEGGRRIEKLYAEEPQRVRDTLTLRYVNDPTILGADVARNRGMEIAQGDIWLFLDDDVALEANFLQEILAAYQRYPRVSGVSGIICNYRKPSWGYRSWASLFVCGPFYDERQPIYWRANYLREAEPIRVRKFTGALMSFRAEVIRGLRFYGAVSDGEDADFCARLGPEAILVIAPRARLKHLKSRIGRPQDHWLHRFARENYYQYHRNWKTGFKNHLSYAWLNIGLGLIGLLASVRRGSSAPWRALCDGAREGARASRVVRATGGPTRFGWRF